MSLKYYRDEFKRYGHMGPISEQEMVEHATKVCAHFNLPRVNIKINKRKKRKSHYYAGLGMVSPKGGYCDPLAVPRLDIAPTMMNWLTFCHELAHHMHYVRFNEPVNEGLLKAGIDPKNTTRANRLELRLWVDTNVKREHAHGHAHRKYMQEIVTFFVNNKTIKSKPSYMPMEAWMALHPWEMWAGNPYVGLYANPTESAKNPMTTPTEQLEVMVGSLIDKIQSIIYVGENEASNH